MNLSIKNDSADSGASQSKRWLLLAALAIVAAIIVAAIYLRPEEKTETAAPPEAASTGTVKFLMEQQWLIKMKLALVEQQLVSPQVTATGRVIPAANRQALVAPPVSGFIQRGQLPRVGQRVAPGQVVATLQQTATSAEQAQLRAAAAQAQTQNTQLVIESARLDAERRVAAGEAAAAQARFDLARKEAERARRLFEQKAYSQRQVETAETDLKTAQATITAAEARLKVLESTRAAQALANVDVGSANAGYVVRAPIGGLVTKVNKSIGEQVAPGEAIIEITNLETVWVEAPIPERDLGRLQRGVAARFTTLSFPDEEFQGQLVDISPIVDDQTRSAKAVFELPNRNQRLRVGMQANLRLDSGEKVAAMLVPKEAVLDHEGKKIVYVLLSGEEFERREVELGDELGDKSAVLKGLKEGERVVTQGAYQLKLQELRPAEAGAHSHET